MEDEDIVISATEIIKGRLYFATLKDGYKPKTTKNSKYFHIEDQIVYENFYLDFGPYHLCHLYQFCRRLNQELARSPKKKVVFYTSCNEALRLNAAYLIGSYQIIYLEQSPSSVYTALTSNGDWSLLTFRDASAGPPLFHISLLDVLQGLRRALDANFFDFEDFSEEEYLFYETVENGDLNWIVPGKMLAFSGPHARSRLDRGYPLHSPEHYHRYFRTRGVSTIVRLNKKSYDAAQFTSHGFQHKELFFVDGSVPTDAIVDRFLRIAELAPGALAVHCKAGLGRTGTLIACYMMKHHEFTAREAVAWLRLCRPGSVIGHQQWFLENAQARMHAAGAAWRARHGRVACARGVYSARPEPEARAERREKPVSLAAILNNCAVRRCVKLDNAPDVNANEPRDSENNEPAPAANRPGYMLPTSNVRNSTATNLKPLSKAVNAAKMHYAGKTSTFPPTRASVNGKSGTKQQFTGKSSFHGQRANLARPTAFGSSPLKGYARKTVQSRFTAQDTAVVTTLTNVTSTLTVMTENCHLNGRKIPSESSIKTAMPSRIPGIVNARKKSIVRSNSVTRKKLPKSGPNVKGLDSNQDLSSSDTNITNMSADSLEVPFRFRRKRDKPTAPEPMDCAHPQGSHEAPDHEETANPQGTELYKIKALRKKCASLGKKEGVQTRSAGLSLSASVKKK